jgi:hypothetical protein
VPKQTDDHHTEAMMELTIGDPVQVWDDDGGRWRFGEVTVLSDDKALAQLREALAAQGRSFATDQQLAR